MKNTIYKPVIGLEMHLEIKTKTKMFCRCQAEYFGAASNTHTCPTCLGLPGGLPFPNKKAIDYCLMLALALGCKINNDSFFERKNYFYPDLPKGYQITQYQKPFGFDGNFKIANGEDFKTIRIRRVHLEEDTGKIIHSVVNGENVSLLDFNRSGVPLVEIVTEPDITSADEAKTFLQELYKVIRYLDISDADMEKGHLRLEPNISLCKIQTTATNNKTVEPNKLPPYKVEVKNINSFRFVQRAIDFEIKRQRSLLEEDIFPKQETRGWNQIKNQTVSQRLKEESHDYRYFPEPDIPPIQLSESYILSLKSQIPELPLDKFKRFKQDYSLPFSDAEILTREKSLADFFEETAKTLKSIKPGNITAKTIANRIINKKIDPQKTTATQLVNEIASSTQYSSTDQIKLEMIIKKVLQENQKAVSDYKKGKTQTIGFLIGMVNKKLQGGKIDPNLIREMIEKFLK